MYKILIVEDDETIAGGLKNHLEKWNYQAECMTDFKDVMGKFVDFDPQLVLLDISLVSGDPEDIEGADHLPVIGK